MIVKTIGSGSSGNGYALISGEDILLLECGVPAKEMLKAIDYQTSMVNGCILSHIHGDHAGYIKQYIQYGIMVYTSDEVETDVETVMGEKTIGLQRMKRQQLGTFSVIPFRVPHGETECDGWLIDTPDGRILFITDAEYCPYDFSKMHINYGLIECNYAEDYIRIEDSDPKYNHVLTGHMELETCKRLIQKINSVTFRSYALAPYNKNIYDPLSNMIAAIRYTVSRYGSLSRGWNGHGYANGGFPMNGEVYVANENGFGSEYIGSIGNRHVVANNNQIVESVSAGVEKANDETNALLRTVIEYQKLILKKDTSVNMDGKRMDKQISKARRNTGFSFSPT